VLKTQVKRQSRELVEEREGLSEQRQTLADETSATQKSILVIEWIKYASQEMISVEKATAEVLNLQQLEQEATRELSELSEQHTSLLELHKRIVKILELRKQLDSKQDEQTNIQSELKVLSEECERLVKKIADQESRIEIATRTGPSEYLLPRHTRFLNSCHSWFPLFWFWPKAAHSRPTSIGMRPSRYRQFLMYEIKSAIC
jgi:DNA repair exonuclease SbcCD ATPase subunit